jgi:hypothetical protein
MAELTIPQRQLLDELHPTRPPEPSGEQTSEQALNFAVSSFDYICQFEGIGRPSSPWHATTRRLVEDRRGGAKPSRVLFSRTPDQ